jgi:hypothetical protein
MDSTKTGRARPCYTDDPVANAMMDFLDERADEWMQETNIVAATNAMTAMVSSALPRPMLERFRRALEAHFHLCFVEGGFRAWEEIAEQQRKLGAPLPPFEDRRKG